MKEKELLEMLAELSDLMFDIRQKQHEAEVKLEKALKYMKEN